ncbi:hypothetical protein PN36_26320 [Candidatus Thiomargarita nelsonii]|uniref:Uncharacterized protein n=1 Tax=Candidatus Thiomargarita nelsonii TaxID=1003181 RepID=A0A4E0QQJ9_9GAMM|nr:hypothetical protein PN36_26320 [Candidatus Thiomargarita nelsonii]
MCATRSGTFLMSISEFEDKTVLMQQRRDWGGIYKVNAIKLRIFCRVGRAIAKPTIVKNFNELVGAAKLYPPYKKA